MVPHLRGVRQNSSTIVSATVDGATSPSRRRPHVLVAEDNLAMSDVIRFNLENSGLQVTVCRDGTDALATLQRIDVDLVVTDYQMPGLDGEELCRRIREDMRLFELPVIMVSAKGLEFDVDRLRSEVGVEIVLYKPFSPRELTRIVWESLQRLPVGHAGTCAR